MADKRRRTPNKDYGDSYQYRQPRNTSSRNRDAGFEDVSSYSSSRDYNKRKKNKKGKTVAKSLIAVLCSILIIAGAVFIYASTYLFGGLTTTELPRNPADLGINSGVQSNSDVKNIALFGIDARGDILEGRCDAVMVLTVDNVHNKLKLTSILRDSLVTMENGSFAEEKLAHAYVYGQTGSLNAIQTINKNYNLDITDYVTVNFAKMAKIVDACGGSRVTITEGEMYEINDNLDLLTFDDPTAVVYESDYLYEDGDLVLNGNQAVAFARIRNIGGDDGRASRQQLVLQGLLANLAGTSLLDYQNLVREVVQYCETSLAADDILTFLPILFNDYELQTLTIPGAYEQAVDGTSADGGWVYVYDLQLAGQHIDAFIREEDSPYYPIG